MTENVSGALWHCAAASAALREDIAAAGAVPPLVQLLRASPSVATHAAGRHRALCSSIAELRLL